MVEQDDRELLRLLIKEAVTDGFADHRKTDHVPLEDRLDGTRKQVWMGLGGIAALGALAKLIGK